MVQSHDGAPLVVRPMRADDVAAAGRLWDEARGVAPGTAPAPPEPTRAARSAAWVRRTTRLLTTDAAGCWAAEDAAGLVGFATSLRREGTWVLATFAVAPGRQGRGTGARLLEAALGHSRGCLRGMLSSSADPRAVRRYVLAGFTLHPQMVLRGRVDRSAIPAGTGERVRDGSAGDVALLDSLDRRCRGAAHGPDHEVLLAEHRLVVCTTPTSEGYAYLSTAGRVELLAASDRRTAEHLLWTALAEGPEETTVPHVTAANPWAVSVGTTARLEVHQEGYLALRGMRPPSHYVHHGGLL